MEKIKQYNPMIDNAKGYLIFLVVFAHFLSAAKYSGSFLYIYIYTFHMPAFIFISGYLCKKNEAISKILKNYLYMYIVWQTIFFLFRKFALGYHESTFYYLDPIHLLWYVLGLLIWHLVIAIVKPETKTKRILLVAVFVVAGLWLGYVDIPKQFVAYSKIVVLAPFFFIGYYFNGFKFFDKITSEKRKIVIIAVVVGTVLIFALYNMDLLTTRWFRHNGTYMEFDYNPLIRFGTLVLGLVMSLAVCAAVPSKKVPLLTYWGKNSFPILVYHGMVIFWLRVTPEARNFLHEYPIMILVVSVAMVWLFSLPFFVKITKPLTKWPFDKYLAKNKK